MYLVPLLRGGARTRRTRYVDLVPYLMTSTDFKGLFDSQTTPKKLPRYMTPLKSSWVVTGISVPI